MARLEIYSRSFVVPASVIDEYRHVNNVAYLAWMHEAASSHIAVLGWSLERCLEVGAAWVVRSHFIEYLRPAFENETVTVYSWLRAVEARNAPRRFVFVRDKDQKPLVSAETVYVCVDSTTGRPIPIPPVMENAFPTVPTDDQVAEIIGIPVPSLRAQ